MSFEAAMEELGALVSSHEFQQLQVAFFDKYCHEFDASAEENKLSYTAIHKEYVDQIEQQIESVLGSEKLEILCKGVEEYATSGHSQQTQAGADALDVLASLSDFESFKRAMLARQASRKATGVELGEVKDILNIADVMDRCAELRQAADEADGWALVVNEPNLVFYTKQSPGGSTYLRYTMELDLPPALAYQMFTDWSPDSLAWREKMTSLTLVKDYGPNDQVVQLGIEVPWAVRYIMSMPDTMCMRVVTRPNWPESETHAYAAVPFDLENGVAMEKMGVMEIKTGVISPHPSDPAKSMFTGCDIANLGIVPSWGVGWILKNMSLPSIASMTSKFKSAKGLK